MCAWEVGGGVSMCVCGGGEGWGVRPNVNKARVSTSYINFTPMNSIL